MLIKHLQLSIALVLLADLLTALNIKSPVIENALFSENVYKVIVGTEVLCHLQLDPTDNAMDYVANSILVLENNHNKQIKRTKYILSSESALRINTSTLNISDTYSCCLEMPGSQKKCSFLVISPNVSSHFTAIAKMFGLLEMLVLVMLFSLCLTCSVLRFKLRNQNKIIEANLQEMDTLDLEKFGSGPYIVTTHAQALSNNVSASDMKNIVLQDADAKSADRVTDGDFPPSYEELVIRRMSQKITPVKY